MLFQDTFVNSASQVPREKISPSELERLLILIFNAGDPNENVSACCRGASSYLFANGDIGDPSALGVVGVAGVFSSIRITILLGVFSIHGDSTVSVDPEDPAGLSGEPIFTGDDTPS